MLREPEAIDLTTNFIQLSLVLSKSTPTLAFNPDVVPYFKEFCLVLDPSLKDKVLEEKSLFTAAGIILKKLSLKSYISPLEKADVEKALQALHLGICKCLIIRFQSKISVFSI